MGHVLFPTVGWQSRKPPQHKGMFPALPQSCIALSHLQNSWLGLCPHYNGMILGKLGGYVRWQRAYGIRRTGWGNINLLRLWANDSCRLIIYLVVIQDGIIVRKLGIATMGVYALQEPQCILLVVPPIHYRNHFGQLWQSTGLGVVITAQNGCDWEWEGALSEHFLQHVPLNLESSTEYSQRS